MGEGTVGARGIVPVQGCPPKTESLIVKQASRGFRMTNLSIINRQAWPLNNKTLKS